MNPSKNDQDNFEQIKIALDSVSGMIEQSQISNLEKDMLKERIRKIYDQLLNIPQVEIPAAKQHEVEIEVETRQENFVNTEAIDDHIHETETDPTEIDSEELIPVLPITDENEETQEEPEGSPDLFSLPDEVAEDDAELVLDKVMNDLEEETVVDQLKKSTKIDNLRESIGINEKFFFINELFEGNLSDYNTAIAIFDEIESMDQAKIKLVELSGKYGWTEDLEAVDQLTSFIERKFN